MPLLEEAGGHPVRFGQFALDRRAGELVCNGTRVKIQEQPLRILSVLLERPGVLVTREELRARLWPSDTFVDFDHGLNKAVNKLRDALSDSADTPRFIETLPRRGYRFIGAVEPAPATVPAGRPRLRLAPEDAMAPSMAASRSALARQADLAEALVALTWSQWTYDLTWEAAEHGFERAIAVDPSYAQAHQLYAHYLRSVGRHVEAQAQAEQALQLDPLSLILNAVVGWHDYLGREPEKAIEQCRRTIEMDPNFARVHSYLGWAYQQLGRHEAAVAELERASELFGDNPSRRAELAQAYAAAGRAEEARFLLAELLSLSSQRYVEPDLVAKIYLGLGEPEPALDWLEQAHRVHSVKRVMLGVDPMLDPLRRHPRFIRLLEELRFPARLASEPGAPGAGP